MSIGVCALFFVRCGKLCGARHCKADYFYSVFSGKTKRGKDYIDCGNDFSCGIIYWCSGAVAIFGISTNIGGFIFPVPMAMILARYGLSGLAIACGVFLLIPVLLAAFTLHETSVGHFKGFELDAPPKEA